MSTTTAETSTSRHDIGGYAVILRHASPDDELRRVAKWCVRARQEGVV
jgi:hypothetical protein